MKYFRFVLILFSLTLLPFSGAHAEELEFEVHGMACSFCAYGLEKKVNKLNNVESFTVDVTTGIARLKSTPGTTMDRGVLEEIAEKSGLKIAKFKDIA